MLQGLLEAGWQSSIHVFLFSVGHLFVSFFLIFGFELDPGQSLFHHVDEIVHEGFDIVLGEDFLASVCIVARKSHGS